MRCFHWNMCVLLHMYLIKYSENIYKQIIISMSQNIEIILAAVWPHQTHDIRIHWSFSKRRLFEYKTNTNTVATAGFIGLLATESLRLMWSCAKHSTESLIKIRHSHCKRKCILMPWNRVTYGLPYSVSSISYAYNCIIWNVIACIFHCIVHCNQP